MAQIQTPKPAGGGAKGLFDLLHEENVKLDAELEEKKRKRKGKKPKKKKKVEEPPKPPENHEIAPLDLIFICKWFGLLLFLAVSSVRQCD